MALQTSMGGSINDFMASGAQLKADSLAANAQQSPLHGQILTSQMYEADSQMRSDQISKNALVQDFNSKATALTADPWSAYRTSAADELAKQATNDPSNIYRDKLQAMASGQFGIDDPSYKFRFDQGQQALERSQASKGLLGSGNAATELVQYGQGMASTEYAAQFQRMLQGMSGVEEQYNSQQSRLMRLAGVQDPGVQSGINAGITQSSISAQASMYNNSSSNNESARQFNVQANQNDQYQAGLRDTLTSAGWY